MQAVKLRARIGADAKLQWLGPLPSLPEGPVAVILVYDQSPDAERTSLSPTEWPVVDAGEYRGGSLRREDIYDDNGR